MGALDYDQQVGNLTSHDSVQAGKRKAYEDAIMAYMVEKAAREAAEQQAAQALAQQRALDAQQKAAMAPMEQQKIQQDNAKAAEEIRRVQQENAAREDERKLKVAESDVLGWMVDDTTKDGKPNPYRTLFAKAPAEAKRHVLDAYGANAGKVRQMWDEQARQMSGDPLLGMEKPEGKQEDITYTQNAKGELSKTVSYKKKDEPQFDSFTTPQEVEAALPEMEAQTAKRIASYDSLPRTEMARFPAEKRMRIMAAVKAYNPEWTEEDANARYKGMMDVKTGKDSSSLQSLNTVMGHLLSLKKAHEGLNNSDYSWINPVKQKMASAGKGGNAPMARFKNAQSSVAAELARVFKGGMPTEKEIAEEMKHFNEYMTKDEMGAAIESMIGLIASRVNALNNKLTNSRMDGKKIKFFGKEAEEAMRELGVDLHKIDPLHPDDKETASPEASPTPPSASGPIKVPVASPRPVAPNVVPPQAAPAPAQQPATVSPSINPKARAQAQAWILANPDAPAAKIARIKKDYQLP